MQSYVSEVTRVYQSPIVPQPSQNLEIHVLSGGKGESIVVRLPDNMEGQQRWGVVDCYTKTPDDPSTNPTIQFLRSRGVEQLEFICLTHPHEDHYRGMSQLFLNFKVLCFWCFNCPFNLGRLIYLLRESARNPEEAENANDLDKTLMLAKETKVKYLTVNKHLYPVPQPSSLGSHPTLQIQAIAPSDDQVVKYHTRVENWFNAEAYLLQKRPAGLDHNAISGALLITYGDTRIVLGGDAERENWQAALQEYTSDALCTHAVKVSHHGSTNGYCDNLWKVFCGEGHPFAIITPYKRYDLPREETVRHIKAHVEAGGENRVMTTCRPSINFAKWDDSPKERTRIWTKQPIHVPDDLPLNAGIIIQTSFWAYQTLDSLSTPDDFGICSLCFNAQGQCIACQLQYPADWL